MFLDARALPGRTRYEADICIVGAGPAGIAIALELIGRGRRIVLVESGGFETDEATSALSKGRGVGQPYFPLEEARSRVFGGTSDQWAGECRPLDAFDFERHDELPDSGWPFSRAELVPFFERARPLFELGAAPFESGDWASHGVRPLPLQGDRVRTGALHYSPPTHFGMTYREQLGEADDVMVLLHATGVELEADPGGERITGLRLRTLAGNELRVEADTFVLAGGGIENPRLMLASNSVVPGGLGNEHDLVGRYFMEHLFIDEAAVVRSRSGTVSEFYTPWQDIAGGRVRGMLELTPEVRRSEGLTNCAAALMAVSPGDGRLTARFVAFETLKGRPPVAGAARFRWAVRQAARERFRTRPAGTGSRGGPSGTGGTTTHLLKHVMEQAPNPESRIVLTKERDALGMPRVELQWRLSPIDKRTAHRAHAIFREDLADVGIELTSLLGTEKDRWPRRLRGARHLMGTTRMHDDPREGVVDADCRVHGVSNLYIAGSSVFPTSGAANPTLTIVALALRLADGL